MSLVMSDDGTPWMEQFEIPAISSGFLEGLTFAVKDFIDIEGTVTGCGNPDWHKSHAPANHHAACVGLLLEQGARCLGKTISDELAYSLVGENHFYGTPLNPAAPDRIPGGSSSGSASVVAAKKVDFALGTDTAGSTRVPASNCGVFGYRPSHGRISLEGVQALAPSFDTVGILARKAEVLQRVAQCLSREEEKASMEIGHIYFLEDAWEWADEEVRGRRKAMIDVLECSGKKWSTLKFNGVIPEPEFGELMEWKRIFSDLQPAENWQTFGDWIESSKPKLGPQIEENFKMAHEVFLRFTPEKLNRRIQAALLLRRFLQPGTALAIPTVPAFPPIKGSVDYDRVSGTYIPRLLAFTSLAGIAGLPEISVPMGNKEEVPVGLSLMGSRGEDDALLSLVRRLDQSRL